VFTAGTEEIPPARRLYSQLAVLLVFAVLPVIWSIMRGVSKRGLPGPVGYNNAEKPVDKPVPHSKCSR
jgi:hypothetical protein